jgi:ankyrin repeat protein
LHLAVLKDNEKVVRHLMTRWPTWKLEKREAQDGTVEYVRVETGARSADVNGLDEDGRTPLHVALREGNYSMVSTLFGYSPDLSIPDANKDLPIHLAAANAPAYIVRRLIERGSPVNTRNGTGKSPLEIAYQRGDAEVYHIILSRVHG